MCVQAYATQSSIDFCSSNQRNIFAACTLGANTGASHMSCSFYNTYYSMCVSAYMLMEGC